MANNLQVIEEITFDIESRLEELHQIEELCLELNDSQNKLFLKGCVLTIYAHWEGFVKYSLGKIIKHINTFDIQIQDYCFNYITFAYESSLKSLENSTSFDNRKKHLQQIYTNLKNNSLRIGANVDTKSNLKFDILKKICGKLNIQINKDFESNYKNDLNALVNIRNSIAHGDGGSAYEFSEFKEIEKYLNLLENLMLDFISLLDELLQQENYKRKTRDG
jgi:hypothetical protein